MHKPCIPGSLSSPTYLEPGYEATTYYCTCIYAGRFINLPSLDKFAYTQATLIIYSMLSMSKLNSQFIVTARIQNSDFQEFSDLKLCVLLYTICWRGRPCRSIPRIVTGLC